MPRYEHSLKLFFGSEAPPQATAQLIDHLAVLLGGVRYTEMVLAWCDEVEALVVGREN